MSAIHPDLAIRSALGTTRKRTRAGAYDHSAQLPVTLGQQLFTIWSNLALGRDVSVKGLPGNAEFSTQVGDLRFRLSHCRLSKTQLGRRHFEWTSAISTARAR